MPAGLPWPAFCLLSSPLLPRLALSGYRLSSEIGGRVERLALIGLAGALGALSRYGLQSAATQLLSRPTVLGTLVVNISGAFIVGLFLTATAERFPLSEQWRTAGAVGFLGAYTTFSTLMLDSYGRFEGGDLAVAVANLTASVLLGLLAVYLGLALGRSL